MKVSKDPSAVLPVKGELDLHNFPSLVIDDRWLGQLDANMLAGVTKMDLRETQVSPTGLARLLECATALQELNIEDLRLPNEVLASIAASPIRKLNASGNCIDSQGLLAFKSPVLESLGLNRTRVNDEGLQKLGDNLPALRSISLCDLHSGHHVGTITDKGIEALVGVSALENLYLDHTKITDRALEIINKLPLLVLTLGKTRVTDYGLRTLKCPRLKALGIYETSIPDLGWKGITDAGLGNLALPSLQQLNVSHNFAIVGTGMPNLNLPALQSLNLSQTKVTGRGLGVGNLSNLIALRLNETPVSDEGLDYINAPALQELALGFNETSITDAGLEKLLLPHFGRQVLFPALRRLDLRYTKITKQGIARLKEYYPELTVETYCQ